MLVWIFLHHGSHMGYFEGSTKTGSMKQELRGMIFTDNSEGVF